MGPHCAGITDDEVITRLSESFSLHFLYRVGPSIPGPVVFECGCLRLQLAFSWFAPFTREYDHLGLIRPQGISKHGLF